jgi:hypothetical protein
VKEVWFMPGLSLNQFFFEGMEKLWAIGPSAFKRQETVWKCNALVSFVLQMY